MPKKYIKFKYTMSKTSKLKKTTKVKKTRRNYTYAQKNKILNQLEEFGNNVLAFSKKVNIPVRTLQSWKENKNKIRKSEKYQQLRKRIGKTNNTALKKRLRMIYFSG
jgi:adenylate cyclase class IV